MASPIKVAFRLKNQAELSSALRRASIATGKLPARLMNRAVLSMAIRAAKKMPVVSPEKIRAELQEYKVAIQSYSKKGKLLGKGKAKSKSLFHSDTGAPLLALIIQSRVGKTGQRGRRQSPWKGVSRSEGAERMLSAMRKVFNARIKSQGFYRTCARAIQYLFKSKVGVQKGDSPITKNTSISSRIGKIAGGIPATGKGRATASFWVSSTQADDRSSLYSVAQPVWQEALNHEAQQVSAFAARKEYEKSMKSVGFKLR